MNREMQPNFFRRSLKYAQDIAEQKGGNFSLYSYTSLEGVCATLCSKGGSLFEIRLESKDEYTGRIIQCSETKRASDAGNSEPARMSDEHRAIYTREFGQQYDLIVMHAQGDLFKSLYLGLTVMATKKPIGSKSKPLDALIFGGLSK